MSDEGEESDSGDRGHPSESPSPPLTVCAPRESHSPARPLDLFSSASPLLGNTDPPYHASPECLHPSPEKRAPGECPHLTPPKFCRGADDICSPFRLRRNVRLDAACDRYDDPLAKWRGRGAANAERFQHRGEGLHRAPELPDRENHYSAEHVDAEFKSDSRQT